MTTRPYRSARRASAAAETRRAVLDAALALFEQRGYVPTTIGDIARDAEVSVNTVYSSIGGKPHLLVELIREASSDDRVAKSMAHVQDARTGHAVLRALVDGTADVFRAHAWLLGELYDNAGSDVTIRDAVAAAEAGYFERLAGGAARLDELGALRAETSVAAAADVLWFYLGFRPWRALREMNWPWERASDWLFEQVSSALLEHDRRDR